MTTQRLDESRLAELVKDAQARRDFSSPELGRMIDHICKKVLFMEDFRKFDDCIKMELYSNGAFDVIKSIERNADAGNGSLFDYFYTIVIHAYN